ncbi:MAG TPA: hypothetical protein VKU00_24185 [Chthonomonadaceae bacterium]|nr:hypothetical protein [Chthonomonadaceae bacterium]
MEEQIQHHPRFQEALSTTERLIQESDDTLYEELALRMGDIYNPGGYARSQDFTAAYAEVASDMGLGDNMRRIGKRWWKNIEQEAWKIICKAKDPELKSLLNNQSLPEAAALLAVGALAALAPPAWVIIIAPLIVRKLVSTGMEAICAEWNSGAEKPAPSSTATPES